MPRRQRNDSVRPDRQAGRRHRRPARDRAGHGGGARRGRRRHRRRQRATWRPTAARCSAASRRQAVARRFTGLRADLADREAVDALAARLTAWTRPSTSWSTTPARIARAPAARAQRRGLGPDHRRRPVEPVRAVPGGRTRHGRAGSREDHLHRVAAELPGRHQRARLHGRQVRHRGPDPGAAERVGARTACNVNAIAPGYIATDNTQALRADAGRNAAILDRIPAGRWG